MNGFNQILDGLIFSDGHITPKGCSFSLGSTKKWYVDNVEKIFRSEGWAIKRYANPHSLNPSKIQYHVFARSGNQIEMKELRLRWYPNSIKVIPSDLKITPLFMNAAWCGDGSLIDNSGILYTNSFTISEVDNFCLQLSLILGCEVKRGLKKKTQPIVRFVVDSMQTLMVYMGKDPIISGFDYRFIIHPLNVGRVPVTVREKSLLINGESPEGGNAQQVMHDAKEIAFLLDESGSFMIHQKTNKTNCKNHPQYLPVVKVSSTKGDKVKALARYLRISKIKETTPKNKTSIKYRLVVTGKAAKQLVKKCAPYLKVDKMKKLSIYILALPMGRGNQEIKQSIYFQIIQASKAIQLQRLNEEALLVN